MLALIVTDWSRGFLAGFIIGVVTVMVISDLLGGYE